MGFPLITERETSSRTMSFSFCEVCLHSSPSLRSGFVWSFWVSQFAIGARRGWTREPLTPCAALGLNDMINWGHRLRFYPGTWVTVCWAVGRAEVLLDRLTVDCQGGFPF